LRKVETLKTVEHLTKRCRYP